jgi:hypothetical protein
VAVTTNIEGREWRRRIANERGNNPKHPRVSTSDDVECYFNMMRDTIGQNSTVKQVKYGFRNVHLKFMKRLDPNLPYYYHTSSHTHFSEGKLPDFSQASKVKKRKSRRLPRREQPAAFTLRCATYQLGHNSTISGLTYPHHQPSLRTLVQTFLICTL